MDRFFEQKEKLSEVPREKAPQEGGAEERPVHERKYYYQRYAEAEEIAKKILGEIKFEIRNFRF